MRYQTIQTKYISKQNKHRQSLARSSIGMYGIPGITGGLGRPTVAGFVSNSSVRCFRLSAEREVSQLKLYLRPPYFGDQRGPNIPTKIKVCGEPSWGVRESVCQIRVQTDERFRRLSHTHKQTNKQTNTHTTSRL